MAEPHTNLGSLYPHQKAALAAFHQVAIDIWRQFGPICQAAMIYDPAIPEATTRIDEALLRAVGMSVRLGLLHAEPTNVGNIVGILRQLADPRIEAAADDAEKLWRDGNRYAMSLVKVKGVEDFGELLDAWLYGTVSHRHDEHQAKLIALRTEGLAAEFSLQVALRMHARNMLVLAETVAEVLGVPPFWEETQPGARRLF